MDIQVIVCIVILLTTVSVNSENKLNRDINSNYQSKSYYQSLAQNYGLLNLNYSKPSVVQTSYRSNPVNNLIQQQAYLYQPVLQDRYFQPTHTLAYRTNNYGPISYAQPSSSRAGSYINSNGLQMQAHSLQDLCAAYTPDERTVIYVLTQTPEQKDEEGEISLPPPKEPSKPEVFFIRYKTQEEADLAQHHIKAQYDALGGTSRITHESKSSVHTVEDIVKNKKKLNELWRKK